MHRNAQGEPAAAQPHSSWMSWIKFLQLYTSRKESIGMSARVRRSNWVVSAIAAIPSMVIALVSSGCFLPTGCDTVLGISYHPADTTIRVGESFHPVVNLTGCRGTKKLSPELRYSADDTVIVQVTFSGVITGRAVGHTTAYVSAAQYGVVAPIGITVR